MALPGIFCILPYAATGNRTHVSRVAPGPTELYRRGAPRETLIQDTLGTVVPRPRHLLEC